MTPNTVRIFLYIPGDGVCAYDIKDSSISSIEDIQSEIASPLAPIEYYNLNGVKVNADNLVPGIYITRQGNKTSKVLIK